jgi:hypothetical protein
MINRMSIEKLAYNIMKRAIKAEFTDTAENEHNLREDFMELAERLGYKVEKVK